MSDKPTAILAKTYKGQGFPDIANAENWHGKPLGVRTAEVLEAIKSRIKNSGPHALTIHEPVEDAPSVDIRNVELSTPPKYNTNGKFILTLFP